MRADYIHRQELQHVLAALTPPNRLAVEISMVTGLRISDVLGIKTEQLTGASERRLSVRELKTGKRRALKLPVELYERALAMAGRYYIFEHRLDVRRPRTRQAVNKDLARAADAFRVRGANLTPHSARKVYAVDEYHRTGDLARVQRLLNHSSEAVTMVYAMADTLTARRVGRKKPLPGGGK